MDLFVVDCGDPYERDLVGVAVDRAGAVALARDYAARGLVRGGYFLVRVVRAGELAAVVVGGDRDLDD